MNKQPFVKALKAIDNSIFPSPKVEGETLRQHIIRTLPLLCLLAVVSHFIDHETPLLSFFENPAIDSFIRMDRIKPEHTFRVEIDEQDYQSMFKRQRPLNAAKIAEIINAIAAGKPRAIVVDLDTEDESYRELRKIDFPCKVIWAREAIPIESIPIEHSPASEAEGHGVKPHAADSEHGHNSYPASAPVAVLGENTRGGIDYGFATVMGDEKGWVRWYPKHIPIVWQSASHFPNKSEPVEEATLPWAAVCAVNIAAKKAGQVNENHKLLFKYPRHPLIYEGYSASLVLAQAEGNPKEWKRYVNDRIALLGGTYRASADFQMTPFGKVPGVNLVGFAIESYLQNDVIHEANPMAMIAADFLIGLLCIAIGHYLPKAIALFIIPIIFPIVVLVISYRFFDQLSLWANFVPLVFGIYLGFVHDHFIEDREIKHEMNEMRKELAEMKQPKEDLT